MLAPAPVPEEFISLAGFARRIRQGHFAPLFPYRTQHFLRPSSRTSFVTAAKTDVGRPPPRSINPMAVVASPHDSPNSAA